MGRSKVKYFSSAALLAASLVAGGWIVAADSNPQQKPQPEPQDSRITRIIATYLPQQHISGEELNDEISRRALRLYLRSLDPMKLYFLQSDIDEFSKSQNRLDDMAREGDLSLAYTIFHRYLDRVDQRVAMALELLDGEFDFTVDESIVVDPEAARYPADEEEARERWRRQVKYSLLVEKGEEKSLEEAVDTIRRRYRRVKSRWHQTESAEVLERYLTSITNAYDPHSSYMSGYTLEDFQMMMRLNLEGIGAALRDKDGVTEVTRVLPGGAAEAHGKLKEGDAIVSVGQGEDGEMVDIVDERLEDVVKLIRGEAGTVVRLGVKPGGVGETVVYTITRSEVQLEDSAARSEIIEVEGNEENGGSKRKIGYINLPSFYFDMEGARNGTNGYRSSTRDVADLLEKFKTQNVEGVVLDLRLNGGGSLTEAINLTGLFIDQGPVVQVKNSDGTVERHSDEVPGVAWDGPLVVLTSKFSASASEILAGAIQDYGRGVVVGDTTTHGKGSVQTLMDLARRLLGPAADRLNINYGALKLTLQQFYLPDGESTQKEGVRADIILPSLTSHFDGGEAELDYALDYGRVPSARHQEYKQTPSDVLGYVRAQSAKRIENSDKFVDLLRRIEIYERQKAEKFVSLNEEKFMARRKELDAQKEEEKEILDQQIPNEEVLPRNYYYDEVLNITRDYVDALNRQQLAQAG